MLTTKATLTITIFFISILFLLWRPRGLNESIPASVGAALIVLTGAVTLFDLHKILVIVTGASTTIISTIVMSIVLESVGFFRWTALNLVTKAKGSGTLLYWYVILLCFLMTMFFNNDGSILITTPIIIEIVTLLNLKPHQKPPYLFSGAIIATASSAPIGVSNLANLIALKIVNMDLVTYAEIMFVPSMAGLFIISLLLFIYFRKDIPKTISQYPKAHMPLSMQIEAIKLPHPLSQSQDEQNSIEWTMFRIYMAIIIVVRASFFILSNYGIPIELIAIIGAVVMIIIRWCRQSIGVSDIVKKTPWHILVFAFSMYTIIYGLHNVGLTSSIIELIREPVSNDHYKAILIMGLLLTVMSNLFNNLPSVMLGTLTITKMGLDQQTLQVAYLANIIGSDIGSLILPTGTLATLIWMFILKKYRIPVSWKDYLSVTTATIPIGLLVTLLCLYYWTKLLF
ncbi:MAG: arsenic transporter [Peptococcaceae bacterium BRH_c4b]|nr:MAG: arsenic transporter [Peptococcaceae bacterium BRH_c4b]